jgi:hypothetical protein
LNQSQTLFTIRNINNWQISKLIQTIETQKECQTHLYIPIVTDYGGGKGPSEEGDVHLNHA